MALQKRRMGKGRIHHRRSAWMARAAKIPLIASCPSCNQPKLPHRVCMKCGKYDGETIIEIASDDDE